MRDGWVATSLSEVVEHTIGGVWGGETGTDEVEVTVVRSTEFTKRGFLNFETGVPRSIKSSQLKSRELKPGDILLEKSGGGPDQPVGRVVFVTEAIPEKFVCSNFVQLVRPNSEQIEPLLLFHIMWQWHAINRTLEFQAQTTGIRNLRTPDYLEQEISLPPLPEQKRIVDLISSVDSYIEALQQQLKSGKRSRNAVLHELLTAVGEEWVETTLGEICTDGLFGDGDWVESKDQDPEGDYRLLQLADIGDGNFLNKSDRWMNQEQFMRLGCTKLEINDVLIARMPDPIGRACLFPEGLPVCATVVDVAIVRTDNETLQKFLVLLINSSDFRTEAFSLLTGTTRQRISRGNLAKITFAIPSPEKQLEIVNLISLFDSEIARTTRVIEEAKQLRSGLLSDLLSGEHEIPASYDKVIGAA
jgi:restriction endonuclease S subunit